jgi:hypothetical protein
MLSSVQLVTLAMSLALFASASLEVSLQNALDAALGGTTDYFDDDDESGALLAQEPAPQSHALLADVLGSQHGQASQQSYGHHRLDETTRSPSHGPGVQESQSGSVGWPADDEPQLSDVPSGIGVHAGGQSPAHSVGGATRSARLLARCRVIPMYTRH